MDLVRIRRLIYNRIIIHYNNEYILIKEDNTIQKLQHDDVPSGVTWERISKYIYTDTNLGVLNITKINNNIALSDKGKVFYITSDNKYRLIYEFSTILAEELNNENEETIRCDLHDVEGEEEVIETHNITGCEIDCEDCIHFIY